MIQHLIKDRFGVSYNVFYIAELLKNLGFSYQKAAFVSAHLDEVTRRRWRSKTWTQILRLAREKKALLLFGDEASASAVGDALLHMGAAWRAARGQDQWQTPWVEGLRPD